MNTMKNISKMKSIAFFLVTALIFTAVFYGAAPMNNNVLAATLFSDNFDDGNATGWSTNSGTWSVVMDGSYKYKQTSTAGVGFAYPTDSSYNNWDNYSVEGTVKITAVDTGIGSRQASISARYLDNNNRYAFVLNDGNDKLEIRKKISGTETSIISKTYTIAAGTTYTVKGVVNGSTLEMWVNGVKELTTTDTARTTGKISINTYGLAAAFDNVVVSTLGSATPTPTPTPTPATYNTYFGLSHSHTDASASHGDTSDPNAQTLLNNSANDQFDEAIANGMQFYMLTDHSQYTNTFTSAKWSDMLTQANSHTVNGSFVGIRGFEFSENNAPGGHMNVYNTNDKISADTAGIDHPYMYDWLATQRQTTPNATTGFNHPSATDFNTFGYFTTARREFITTCEVMNGVNPKDADGNIIGSLHYSNWLIALEHGWRVSPRAGGDAHVRDAIHKFLYRCGIVATSLTKDSVLDAFANRRTYATHDKNLSCQYTVNGAIMGSVLSSPSSFTFSITASDPNTGDNNDKINKIEIMKDNGVVVQTYNPTAAHSITWNPSAINDSTSQYFFVRVWTVGKTDGPTAYLAPVWTGR